ncbi:MAG: cation-transporting P-type ATPase [Gloeomargarita sp. GMQP_bins_120]
MTSPVFHALDVQQVLAYWQTEATVGLPAEEVARRYEQYGPNELPEQRRTPAWLKFLQQFHQPLLYILLVAGLVKAFLRSWLNALVIWGVTVINAVISYIQETQAEGAIASLAKVVTTETTVLRDGQRLQVPARELVPGDIVFLHSGDKVPADMRLLAVRNLQVDESALTGESVPVTKTVETLPAETPLAERRNMAYAGSLVTFGQGQGVVVATGTATEVGQIARSMQERVSLSTPLTRKFAAFSHTILYVVLGLAAFTFAVGAGRGKDWVEMFEAAVALAVSAIPEGLPAVVTVTLAIGVNRMAQRHAIIRKLPAVEALGSATVICSDKTGTLTENQMTVQAVVVGDQEFHVTGSGYSPKGEICTAAGEPLKDLPPGLRACLVAGVLCNDSRLEQREGDWRVVGDPTEGALLAVAEKAGLSQAGLTADYPRLDAIPFESDYQYMATLNDGQPRLIYVKGAVEVVLARCRQAMNLQGELVPLEVESIRAAVERLAENGLRVLAFAQKTAAPHQHSLDHEDIAEGLVFLGLQGMIDPPRPEAIVAVHHCQTAGIQVKMITGDHVTTARAIAQRMGIQTAEGVVAFTGAELAAMDSATFTDAALRGSVFARVAPSQKLQLVEALQSRGHIVAMTGDGVNDAPALRQADIGIAMGKGGTEVAREAADMLLTDDNFASIAAAVEEGRTVYQNLRKAIAFLLPVNGGESMTILISALLLRDLPILSLQVLWLNMINSITMTVPLAFEPKPPGVMEQPPRNPDQPLLTPKLIQRILLVSAFNWVLIFGMFEWVKGGTGNLALARTMAIQALVAARIIYLISLSQFGLSLGEFLRGKTRQITPAPTVFLGIAVAVLLQILFSQWPLMNTLFATAPLSGWEWLICLLPMLPMLPVAWAANALDPALKKGSGMR